MKTSNSIKKRCPFCKIFYKHKRLYMICVKKRHNKRQK